MSGKFDWQERTLIQAKMKSTQNEDCQRNLTVIWNFILTVTFTYVGPAKVPQLSWIILNFVQLGPCLS